MAATARAVDAERDVPPRPPAYCSALAPLGRPPADAVSVTRFGARGDDEGDDTDAIERALRALRPGQTLVFPPGRYLQARRLAIAVPRVTLWGEGATLHATNPADQALLVQADGVRVLGFTLTAVTDRRRSAPQESRIAIWRDRATVKRDGPLHDVTIRANRIVPAVPPSVQSGPLANSSSSAAIFVSGVDGFLVAQNTVERSLSDGIHVTGGARNGRVLANRVRQTGDDMIAVVSYLGDGPWTRNQTAEIAATLDWRRANMLVRNVLIADNDVGDQYWGRGISVVGGEDITIRNNRIVDTPHAAAIYIAREQGYVTFGVRNVRVQDNTIAQVQTRQADYNPLPLERRLHRTGHGAVEVIAHAFDDELANATLAPLLGVQDVRIEGNRIGEVRNAGVRIAYGSDETQARSGNDDKGQRVTRVSRGSRVRDVQVLGNRFERIGGRPIEIHGDPSRLQLACARNEAGDRPIDGDGCGNGREPAAPITGSSLRCN